MNTIRSALSGAVARLSHSDTPRLDAEVLLAHALGKDRSHLFAWPERALTPAQHAGFTALIERRAAGEPVAHILGRREFWSLELEVTPDTLIPRPETERLVELALELIPAGAARDIADLGTGSGAIALALASERPDCRLVATDASAAALEVARANAGLHGLEQIDFRRGDWCAALGDATFDLIVANPPYIASADPHLRQGDVRFDPVSALASGADGLDDIRRIAAQAWRHLRPGGWLLLEHGHDQATACIDILTARGYEQIRDFTDLSGRPRVVRGQVPAVP